MLNVLVGGVPYGTQNIGDEAILSGVVSGIRRLRDDLEFSVITASPEETAEKLGVRGINFSFDSLGQPEWTDEIFDAFKRADLYVHGGATGLHDYPMHRLKGLRIAKESGCLAMILATGGGQYNHKFWEGRKTRLLEIARRATLGLVDFRKILEARASKKYRRAIFEGLNAIDLILVRDENTRQVLLSYGLSPDGVGVSGDAAYGMMPAGDEAAARVAAENNLWDDDAPVVAVCISSQQKVTDMAAVVRLCDNIIEDYGAHLLFVPMNPTTDDKVGDEIAKEMKRGERTRMIRGYVEPEDLLAFLSRIHLIVSSRLHLMILGALAGVPSVGIARGSGKVATFQKRFGLDATGDYLTVNYEMLSRDFDDVWKRRDELSRIIVADMTKARKFFENAGQKIADLLHTLD